MKLFEISKNQYGQWEDWFAWFPVETLGGEILWLETVQKKTDVNKNREFTFYLKKDNDLGKTNKSL